MTGIARVGRGAACAFALTLLTAPTPGDVGGCGAPARDLEEGRFVRARKIVDCRRCAECRLSSSRCARACDAAAPPDDAFPPTCHPLYHDGEVCLDALLAASCDDYAGYVRDDVATVPSECAFCRVGFDAGSAER